METPHGILHLFRPGLQQLQRRSSPFHTHYFVRSLKRSPGTFKELSACASAPVYRRNIPSRPLLRNTNLPKSHLRKSSISTEAQNPTLEAPGTTQTPANDENSTVDVPSYELTFTCKPCFHRATHRVSKQGYTKGTVIITCPKCQARHLISDHLRIFRDRSVTIEDILRDKGELFKKGRIDPSGDFELWDDGSQTKRLAEVKREEQKARRLKPKPSMSTATGSHENGSPNVAAGAESVGPTSADGEKRP